MSREMKKFLTLAELKKLKPSKEAPVLLRCFDKFYTNYYKELRVILVEEKTFSAINTEGRVSRFMPYDLEHFEVVQPKGAKK